MSYSYMYIAMNTASVQMETMHATEIQNSYSYSKICASGSIAHLELRTPD